MQDFIVLLVAVIIAILGWKFISKHFIDKNKNKLVSHSVGLSVGVILFFTVIAIYAPTQNYDIKEKETAFKVLSVSDYKYTMSNKPAVSIMTGETTENYIDITLHRDSIKQNFELDTRKNKTDHDLVSITLNWDKNTYVQNTKSQDYYVKVKILELNETKKEAKIQIEANLYSTKTNTFKDINTKITLTNDNFINLTKQI